MSINCNVILQRSATPTQLSALGAALWHWCTRVAGPTGMYQFVDNQALADLIAGNFPMSDESPSNADFASHLWIRDVPSHNRQSTINSLRREIPVHAVADIVVGGTSWNPITRNDTHDNLQRA